MLKGMLGYKEKLLFQEKKAFCLKFVNYLFIFFFYRKNQEYLLKSLLKLVVLATKVLEYVYVKVLKIWLDLLFFFKNKL